MRKKWIGVGIVILLCLTIVNVVYGAQALTLIIKGQKVQSDVPPKIENGHTYVPLRVVSDYLDEDIDWDSKTKTVTIHPDVWDQDLESYSWISNRNTVIQFLMAFDERNEKGKQLVSEDFQSNFVGSEVVIPIGGSYPSMVDYQFVDAKVDNEAKTMTIRVKIWWHYYPADFQVKTWDFTLDLTKYSDEHHYRHVITKVWEVDTVEIDSHTVFPGLTFTRFTEPID